LFRRIQLINRFVMDDGSEFYCISGLSAGNEYVLELCSNIPVPKKRINKSGVKFYFTEYGWNEFGREIISRCNASHQEYRVITTEEHDVDVYYQDNIQVGILPKRKNKW
jgi:hypothetical protein